VGTSYTGPATFFYSSAELVFMYQKTRSCVRRPFGDEKCVVMKFGDVLT